ncbi:hypothetical protein NE236_36960 [Actinoallomurus purpureus]|uniref:hypothetical protein n=1 Tax=Actinoallomurus purpureus TaxID=478114 RepID=UPI002092D79C|nr:hypothetical protein [Actinoallomurus purpureus]MCO6010564.1 hypothetical protein [Actinoallomurus purpureus]
MSPIPGDLAALLRVGARGYHPEEAAIKLLIDHGTWLRRQDFTRACVVFDDAQSAAFIDWRLAIKALNAGDLPCSASEANILRLATALNGGPGVSLRDALIGLDSRNIRLVAQAVLHANGTTNGTVTVPEPRRFPPGVRVVDAAGNVLQDGQDGEEP